MAHFDNHMMKELSSQLGRTDYADIESEGRRLWDALNDLRCSDPNGYDLFISRQLQQMSSGEESNPKIMRSPSTALPPFVPFAGYVVKAFVEPVGVKIFINLCYHDTVQRPVNGGGNLVKSSCESTDGLNIPLLISKLRKCYEGSDIREMSVDAVVNPWIINMCHEYPLTFKPELIALVLQYIEDEHSIKIIKCGEQTSWKIIRSKYKHGVGPGNKKVRPFELRESSEISDSFTVQNPSDILKSNADEIKNTIETVKLLGTYESSNTKMVQEVASYDSGTTDVK